MTRPSRLGQESHTSTRGSTTAITAVSNTLQRLNAMAERWATEQRWTLLLTRIFRRWLGGKWLGELPPQAALFLSG